MSQQFLSQEEVDALLEGADGEEAAPAADSPDGVRTYNLASQERIVRGRMPTLEIVNERFARNLRIGLFNFMRKNPEILSPISGWLFIFCIRSRASSPVPIIRMLDTPTPLL